jgi:hypothetical protein
MEPTPSATCSTPSAADSPSTVAGEVTSEPRPAEQDANSSAVAPNLFVEADEVGGALRPGFFDLDVRRRERDVGPWQGVQELVEGALVEPVAGEGEQDVGTLPERRNARRRDVEQDVRPVVPVEREDGRIERGLRLR